MRKPALLATLVASALVASLAATIPGAFAGPQARKAKVMTGVISVNCYVDKAGDLCLGTASFPSTLTVPLADTEMGITGGLVEHVDCLGDQTDPEAADNILCIYPVDGEIVNIGKNGEGAWNAQAYPINDGRNGFKVAVNGLAPGRVEFEALWAIRA